MCQSHDSERIWCKTATSLLIPQWRVFTRNLFNKIDTEASYLPYRSVKIHLPLSCELENQIRALCSKYALYKLWGRGRTPSVSVTSFQRQHLRGELWLSKNKAEHSSAQWTVSSLLFSRRKYCCTQSAYLTSSLQTEVEIQDHCNKRSHLVSYFLYV